MKLNGKIMDFFLLHLIIDLQRFIVYIIDLQRSEIKLFDGETK